MGQWKIKACLFLAGVILLFLLTFAAQAVVAQNRAILLSQPDEERIRRIEQDVSTSKVRIEEIADLRVTLESMSRDTTANRIAIATIQANFSIVYGALTFLGGLVLTNLANTFFRDRKLREKD